MGWFNHQLDRYIYWWYDDIHRDSPTINVWWLTCLLGLPGLGFTFSKSLELPSFLQATGGTTENANGSLKMGDFRSATVCGKWWVTCFLRVASAVWLVFSVLSTVQIQFVLIIVGYVVERCVIRSFLISFIRSFFHNAYILSFVRSFIWCQFIWFINDFALYLYFFLDQYIP